jgi:N-dimethylarginine dimethylaminohydrolase
MFSNNKCIDNVDKASRFPLDTIGERAEPDAILMCEPTYFEVKEVKNLFMEGNINATKHEIASNQWQSLKKAFERIGYVVDTVQPEPGLEDMVFTANQVLLGQDAKGPYVVLSRMRHPSRRQEIPIFAKWFKDRHYRIVEISKDNAEGLYFEGQGDALWHPGKQLLYGGYGQRTDVAVYPILSALLDIPIILLPLIHPRFYHLDTAFCPLDQKTVMACRAAFDNEGWGLIKHYFPNVVSVSEADAQNFACNALALGKNVVIQKGSIETVQQLRALGFNPIEVETSEFMKSGGSVSCLKMMTYA